jgi:kynurenine formamidase
MVIKKNIKFPFKVIDLTHPLSKNSPSWGGGCGFTHEIELDYHNCKTGVKFRVQRIKMDAGIGTHIDAPAHCNPAGETVEELPMENLVVPCIVIDVSSKAHSDFKVEVSEIIEFEKRYGEISQNSFVIFYTGWDRYWNEPDKYHNNYKFPTIDAGCSAVLLERDIAGIGIDTLSPDRPSEGFPMHKAILGKGKYIVENIANCHLLPPVGSYSLALPIKTVGGTEAPIRLIALIK